MSEIEFECLVIIINHIWYVVLNNVTEFVVVIVIISVIALILYVLFLLWQWILKQFMKKDDYVKAFSLILGFISTFVVYAGVMYWYFFYYPNRNFNKEEWFNNKEKRYELSHDIIESRMLIGKTKKEVQQILGNEYSSDGEDHWMYELGFRPQISMIDPDVLDVIFYNGKVVRVGQHET